MSPFPITPLVRQVQGLVLLTFDVSEQTALDYAAEAVSLAEGWGSPETAAQLNWSHQIRKDLGRKAAWKSEAERTSFFGAQEQWQKDYNSIFSSKPRA